MPQQGGGPGRRAGYEGLNIRYDVGVGEALIRADHLRDALNVPDQGFSTLLIGKDDGVRMRSRQLAKTEDLFALIDDMPMRQREMREQSCDRRH